MPCFLLRVVSAARSMLSSALKILRTSLVHSGTQCRYPGYLSLCRVAPFVKRGQFCCYVLPPDHKGRSLDACSFTIERGTDRFKPHVFFACSMLINIFFCQHYSNIFSPQSIHVASINQSIEENGPRNVFVHFLSPQMLPLSHTSSHVVTPPQQH